MGKRDKKDGLKPKKTVKRDEHGRFVSGTAPGPGRPVFSLLAILKEELQRMPVDKQEEYARLWLRKYIQEGYEENDGVALRDSIDRIDGRPHQTVTIDNEKDAQWLELLEKVASRTEQ